MRRQLTTARMLMQLKGAPIRLLQCPCSLGAACRGTAADTSRRAHSARSSYSLTTQPQKRTPCVGC